MVSFFLPSSCLVEKFCIASRYGAFLVRKLLVIHRQEEFHADSWEHKIAHHDYLIQWVHIDTVRCDGRAAFNFESRGCAIVLSTIPCVLVDAKLEQLNLGMRTI